MSDEDKTADSASKAIATVDEDTPKEKKPGLFARMGFGERMSVHNERKTAEAYERLDVARANQQRAHRTFLQEQEATSRQYERLRKENVDAILAAETDNIQAELQEAKGRRQSAERQVKLNELLYDAEEIELQERIAKAKARIARHERNAGGDNDGLAKAEQALRTLHQKWEKAASEQGSEMSEEDEDWYRSEFARLNKKVEQLREQQQRDRDADFDHDSEV